MLGADGAHRRRADRLDGRRHAAGRAVQPAAAPLRLLLPAVRAGHEPAAGCDQGRARHLAGVVDRAGAQPLRSGAGVLPADRAALPGLSDSDLAKIIHINDDGDLRGFAVHVVDGRYRRPAAAAALRERLDEIRAEVSAAISAGRTAHRAVRPRQRSRFGWPRGPTAAPAASGPGDCGSRRPASLARANRDPGGAEPGAAEPGGEDALAPIPSLLLTGAVHHHLIRARDQGQGRPHRGKRRRARVPSHRAADRLRCRRRLPVPGDRVRRGHGPARRAGRGHHAGRPRPT